jgi:hypothetical protein
MLPAPQRKAEVQSKQVLSEPSLSAGGAGGPGVRGKFIRQLARSDDSRRSCRPVRIFFWGGFGHAAADQAPVYNQVNALPI